MFQVTERLAVHHWAGIEFLAYCLMRELVLESFAGWIHADCVLTSHCLVHWVSISLPNLLWWNNISTLSTQLRPWWWLLNIFILIQHFIHRMYRRKSNRLIKSFLFFNSCLVNFLLQYLLRFNASSPTPLLSWRRVSLELRIPWVILYLIISTVSKGSLRVRAP